MLTTDGPKVLEYNCRFGDPETQTLLPLLDDSVDLAEIMLACVERRLDSVQIKVKSGYSVTVVAASGGYPGTFAKNYFITLTEPPQSIFPLSFPFPFLYPVSLTPHCFSFCFTLTPTLYDAVLISDSWIFHAGTAIGPTGHLMTAGGRVFAVTATASDLKSAVSHAYEAMNSVKFAQMHFRKDIAYRAFRQVPTATKDTSGSKSSGSASGLTYAAAGVDIDAGNEMVRQIKPFVKRTRRPGADGEIGGFGGLFNLKAAGFEDPVLVAGIDGIGTKLKIAQAIEKYDTIGTSAPSSLSLSYSPLDLTSLFPYYLWSDFVKRYL